jgi:hypothetical protein
LEFARLFGMTIPGANVEAFVASKESISDQGAKLLWNRTWVLDGQVGQTAACIENVGLRKSLGGAGIEAAGATATVVVRGGVGRNF